MKNILKNGSIEKINKQSAVDLVLEQMKTLIKDGTWTVGQKIPSESDLADVFAVNRLTIRMALQKLSTFGLVQTRVGEGTFITEFSLIDYIKQISEFYNHDQDVFDDIANFREAVEIRCCALAMERVTEEELAHLHKLLVAHENVQVRLNTGFTQEIYLDSVDTDLHFHEYICTISNNSLLIAAFSMAKDIIYQHLLMIVRKRIDQRLEKMGLGETAKRNIHRDIFESIVDKDFEKCKKTYLDMLNQRVNLYEF